MEHQNLGLVPTQQPMDLLVRFGSQDINTTYSLAIAIRLLKC